MLSSSSLLVDKPGGKQIVRNPHPADAIGALLQRVFAVRRAVPDAITRLLPMIDRTDRQYRQRLTGRR